MPEERREEHIAWLENNGVLRDIILSSDESVENIVAAIAGEKRDEFGGLSLDEVMIDTTTSTSTLPSYPKFHVRLCASWGKPSWIFNFC